MQTIRNLLEALLLMLFLMIAELVTLLHFIRRMLCPVVGCRSRAWTVDYDFVTGVEKHRCRWCKRVLSTTAIHYESFTGSSRMQHGYAGQSPHMVR
ncbi:MAG: hypothetical protein ACT4OO_08825 [Nitrospiraceae bacterium]